MEKEIHEMVKKFKNDKELRNYALSIKDECREE